MSETIKDYMRCPFCRSVNAITVSGWDKCNCGAAVVDRSLWRESGVPLMAKDGQAQVLGMLDIDYENKKIIDDLRRLAAELWEVRRDGITEIRLYNRLCSLVPNVIHGMRPVDEAGISIVGRPVPDVTMAMPGNIPPPRKEGWEHSERVLAYCACEGEHLPEKWGLAYYHYKPPFEEAAHWVSWSIPSLRTPTYWWHLPPVPVKEGA